MSASSYLSKCFDKISHTFNDAKWTQLIIDNEKSFASSAKKCRKISNISYWEYVYAFIGSLYSLVSLRVIENIFFDNLQWHLQYQTDDCLSLNDLVWTLRDRLMFLNKHIVYEYS